VIIGMLSDAHGSAEGLEVGVSVLRRLGAERIFFLGDAVGYLPGTAAIDAILTHGLEPLAGNHEAMLLGREPMPDEALCRLRSTRHELGSTGLALIARWPTRRTVETASGPVLLVHDGPYGDRSRIYPDADLTRFGRLPWAAVCMGHTHRAFVRRVGATNFMNVGSCGLPRDDGRLGAVATLDTISGEAAVVRFDLVDATREALQRVGEVHPHVVATFARRERPDASARASIPRAKERADA
jgi:predicted phosphodiesterase